jgi:hypothetical protein
MLAQRSRADVPTGFSWVNLESDKAIMTTVRHALHDNSITAIREVGVEDGFALVMTASREAGSPVPSYDRWTVYNVSLSSGKSRVLISGYGVELLDWLGSTQHELAITYFDCWECEAAKIFTTLRFVKGVGWRARWSDKAKNNAYPQPGVVVSYGDAGEPYDDDEVDQVFAIVSGSDRGFEVGSWFHSRNIKTGKIDDAVMRYSTDPTTQDDRVEKLSGAIAQNWERKICAQSSILIQPSIGQDSKSCKGALRIQGAHQQTSK